MLFQLRNIKYAGILDLPEADIPEGKVTCIFGESGAGKTTVLRMLNHLISPDEGTIKYRDKDVMDYDPVELRRSVVMLGQHPAMFPGTIADNLQIGRLFADKEQVSDDDLRAMLKLIKLDKPLDGEVETLSGGEQQRVALGRVLLMDPDVLLLDEPSSALDEDTEHMIIERVVQWAKDKQRTLVMVTHARWVVENYGDELLELAHGHRKGDGSHE